MEERTTLRERKRRQTRALLIETGRRLFEANGYDQTTVADIAAAAEIGTRTFFAYFESKEQLLFDEIDPRVISAIEAIRTRAVDETPAQTLLRGLNSDAIEAEAHNPVAQLRLRLLPDVPAIQARALRLQLDAQDEIQRELRSAYPELTAVEAAALVGAITGAVAAAYRALGEEGAIDERQHEVHAVVERVLHPR
ncbi:TetR/AcrR family transcriptional regulator [Microbacterium sp. JB110]|uniref:TetR/AcrR family transcriptional regulator n=1 Tax=Microbacterium sp. JB110 TaxID=2024477 RepID=UPI001BAFC4D7|nr:TetR/AcrR family transcriptional regulator [Microbacterium sp. JB110]